MNNGRSTPSTGKLGSPAPSASAAAVVQTISGAINLFSRRTSHFGCTRPMFNLAPAVFAAHEPFSLHRSYIRCLGAIFAAQEPFSSHQIPCQPLSNL